jgi:hypothetical protein
MGTRPSAFLSVLAGSGTRRYKISAIAVPHLIEQPYLEAEGGRLLVAEFHLHDFPNIQTGLGLETEAGFAEVGADPFLRLLIQ